MSKVIYSMVTVMAVTTVFFATKQYQRNHKNFGEPVINITITNMSEPHKFNGTSIDNVIYKIDNFISSEEEEKEVKKEKGKEINEIEKVSSIDLN